MPRIANWEPENPAFWESEGRRHARRNLWISVPSLLCAFAVWMVWSIVVVQMKYLQFPFEPAQFYMLLAIPGLVGATLRIPNSFFIALAGGRTTIAVTTALLILPALGAGIFLQDRTTPFWVFAVLAGLSGIGGGNFASSMSNISFFYPKSVQGTALGVNAGLGNLGVSVMQFGLPIVMGFALFGPLSGEPHALPVAVGNSPAGTPIWIQNAGLVWVPALVLLMLLAWILMDNLPQHDITGTVKPIGNVLWLTLLGFAAAALGIWLQLLIGLHWAIALPIVIALTLALMRYASPKSVRENLARQFEIFNKKHTWVMTWLYVMTFGSFIGYSAAFPVLIQDVFGTLPDGSVNPNAPSPYMFAWLGPLVGSLARPLGGWISDKWGGARVTHWDTVIMILAALGVAYFVTAAGESNSPEDYFLPFLLLFLLLFITTGIGNGSTFRMIPIIFEPKLAGPILGWTSAVAAYGAFIIPKVFGSTIQIGHPEYALIGFAVYYLSCLAVNWWFYARRGAEVPC